MGICWKDRPPSIGWDHVSSLSSAATGFLGRRIVRHLYARGCVVRIASRHADQGRALFGTDDPRLRPDWSRYPGRQSVADALADAHAAVNAISLVPNVAQRPFTWRTWNAPSASPLRRTVSGSNSLCTYPGSALTLRLDHPMSAAVVKANRLFGRPLECGGPRVTQTKSAINSMC